MKNRIILLLSSCFIGCCIIQGAVAQKLPPGAFGHQIVFSLALSDSLRAAGYTDMSYGTVDKSISSITYKPMSDGTPMRSLLMLGVKLNPTLTNYGLSAVKSFSKYYSAYRISDSSNAIMIALGINKDNIKDYRYRVVLNDSVEVVHWSKIPKLEQKYNAEKPYGFVGSFKYLGKQALVEVVNINDYQMRDGIIFDWRENFKPVSTNFLVHGTLIEVKGKINTHTYKPRTYKAKRDPVTHELTEIRFVNDSVDYIRLSVREHPAIYYNVSLTTAGDDEHAASFVTAATGDHLSTEFTFDHLPLLPGKYIIVVQPQVAVGAGVGKDQTLRIPITILAPPSVDKKFTIKQLLPYFIAAVILIGLLFWLYRRRANMRLARSRQAKQNVSLQMRSIRAQLNPHFMFNALTSIQNLVNKQDMESANHYLSRFSSLTRKVLNTGEKDLISLEDELKILDDYLQMEQLRFGFQYYIEADPDVNLANTEVPAMLLQPFVENAVKHGVADLHERGEITVAIRKENNNLNLIIIDNGAGFPNKIGQQSSNSFGLKLNEERIELLNQVYSGKPFSLNIKTGKGGTVVTVTLANWIS